MEAGILMIGMVEKGWGGGLLWGGSVDFLGYSPAKPLTLSFNPRGKI